MVCSSEMQTESELKICSEFYQLYTVIRVESVSISFQDIFKKY